MTINSEDAPTVGCNQYGFYELLIKPSPEELREYYAEKYYQQSIRVHQQRYDEQELVWRRKKLALKSHLAEKYLANLSEPRCKRFLDVGAGEGFALRFFSDAGWSVKGLDFSQHGCSVHNPDMLACLTAGDIEDSIAQLVNEGAKFELILLDNILEHLLNPLQCLKTLTKMVASGGFLMVEVPNEFSPLQQTLLQSGCIEKPFWVVSPDHISYFNPEGLKNLCQAAGFQQVALLADYPIDLALFNEATNYVSDRNIGRSVHQARMKAENLIHDISLDKAVNFYAALAELGLGRNLLGIYKLNENRVM